MRPSHYVYNVACIVSISLDFDWQRKYFCTENDKIDFCDRERARATCVCKRDSINLITGITKSVSRTEGRGGGEVGGWQAALFMAARASGPLDMVDGTRGVKFAGFPLAGFTAGGWRADGSCRWLPSKASNRYSLPLRSTPLSFGCGSDGGGGAAATAAAAALSGYLLDTLCVHTLSFVRLTL